jgi:hypothetical protein
MLMTDPLIADLWEKARFGLKAHLDQRSVEAVFLEGSIAEGFGNERSDVDFVGIIDDASQLRAIPYMLFIDGRRIEVLQLLSSAKLRRELRQVRATVSKGLSAVAGLSWNLLERCQSDLVGALPIHNGALIGTLQGDASASNCSGTRWRSGSNSGCWDSTTRRSHASAPSNRAR